MVAVLREPITAGDVRILDGEAPAHSWPCAGRRKDELCKEFITVGRLCKHCVRRMVYDRLPRWGDYLRHGYLPGQGDGIASGNKPDSRLPAPTWLFDLSLAFAALNPTGPEPVGIRFTTLARRHFNEQQRVIWHYYAPDDTDTGPDTRVADAQQWQHQRERELDHAIRAHDSKRDADVAKLLHLDSRRVRYLRQGAVWTMSTLVGWERE